LIRVAGRSTTGPGIKLLVIRTPERKFTRQRMGLRNLAEAAGPGSYACSCPKASDQRDRRIALDALNGT